MMEWDEQENIIKGVSDIMKRILFTIAILLALLCGVAAAEEADVIASGNCGASGANVTWTFDSKGSLLITGRGGDERLDGYPGF